MHYTYTPSIPVDQQRLHASKCSSYDIFSGLIFNNRQLNDTLMLTDYLIKKESMIQLRKQYSVIALPL